MLKIKVFISYKTGADNTPRSVLLSQILHEKGFDVFIDKEGMTAGHKWPEMIYDNVVDSDVLVVLLTPETVDSNWVRREVDLAKGAHIAILPILVAGSDSAEDVLKALGLNDTQYFDFQKQTSDRVNDLINLLNRKSIETYEAQKNWIDFIQNRDKERSKANFFNQPASTESLYKTYYYLNKNKDKHHTRICIATGNMVDMRNIDAIVNSENSYMQMARFFERNTVSANIRQSGVRRIGYSFYGDSIQDELDYQIKTQFDSKIPIDISQVVATTSGDEDAKLYRNHVRYILHVATLRPAQSGKVLEKLKDVDLVKECVTHCLEEVIKVDNEQGNIFVNEQKERFADIDTSKQNKPEDYEPIKSIIFPLLATGSGGLEVLDAVSTMVDGIIEFLDNYSDTHLEHIHIGAFLNGQVKMVENYLDEHPSLQESL